MDGNTLQMYRRMLFLTVAEAVAHIQTSEGKPLNARKWQRIEKGETAVPDDVAFEIKVLVQGYFRLLNACKPVAYYRTIEEYFADYPSGDFVDWRVRQAVASAKQMLRYVPR